MEDVFRAEGWDILSAIERGFRAQVDVKGKLAELFLHRTLCELRESGAILSVTWSDTDGQPDFEVDVNGRKIRLECKNVRSGEGFRRRDTFKVELQKTRNAIGGGPSRGYRVDEFDILAACLFNQTGEWRYLFCATVNLQRRPAADQFLVVFQKVPMTPGGIWHDTFEGALGDLKT